MKITAIKTFMGLFSGRNRRLIKVETDEGIHGWGETYSIGPDLSIEPILPSRRKHELSQNFTAH